MRRQLLKRIFSKIIRKKKINFPVDRVGIPTYNLAVLQLKAKPMTKRENDISSLEHSIIKWTKNATAQSPENIDTSCHTCALCMSYALSTSNVHNSSCKGCPIYTDTGKAYCKGTPYTDVIDAKRAWVWLRSEASTEERAKAEAQQACLDEVEYLKSVLQKVKDDQL